MLLLLSAIWGSSFFWTKIALRAFSPAAIVCGRMGIAAVVLGATILATRTPLPRSPRVYGRLALLSLLNVTIPFTLVTWGQQFTGSALASVLSSTTPLFVFAIAVTAVSDERFTWTRLAGTLIAFGGIAGLLAGATQFRPAGAAAVLGSSAIFACGNVVSRRVIGPAGPLVAAFVQAAFGCLFELPMIAVSGARAPAAAAVPASVPAALLAVGWLGVLGSALAYLIYFRLLTTLGSTRTSMNTYLQPVTGVLLGVAALGERLTARSVLAIAVIAAGVMVFALASRPPVMRLAGGPR